MSGRVSITFDDGLESVYSLALPELDNLGVTATVFVISDLVGKTYDGRAVMNGRMLNLLRSKGWEIGSHTSSHANLTELSPFNLMTELKDSKKRLEEIISAKVVSFAYPFGAYDNNVKAAVARNYTYARSVSCYPPLRLNSPSSDPLELSAMSTYARAFTLPIHLFDNHVARKISYRPRTRTSRTTTKAISPSRKGLEARFVKKWVEKLRRNQWLILCFHDVSAKSMGISYTIDLEEFRAITKAIVKEANVVNLGEGVQEK